MLAGIRPTEQLVLLDETGRTISHINKENGLNNNTVLALSEDRDGNLWLGLDNGISVINRSSAFSEFNDPAGRLGVVYAAAVFEGFLYIVKLDIRSKHLYKLRTERLA